MEMLQEFSAAFWRAFEVAGHLSLICDSCDDLDPGADKGCTVTVRKFMLFVKVLIMNVWDFLRASNGKSLVLLSSVDPSLYMATRYVLNLDCLLSISRKWTWKTRHATASPIELAFNCFYSLHTFTSSVGRQLRKIVCSSGLYENCHS